MAKTSEKLKSFLDAIKKIDETLLDESIVKDIEQVFDEAVAEEMKSKLANLDESINAVIKTHVDELKTNFDEAVEAKAKKMARMETRELKRKTKEEMKDLAQTLDESLNHAVAKFMEENKIAMAKEVEIERAKALDESVSKLIKDFKIEIDNDLDESQKLLKDALASEAKLRTELNQMKRTNIINDLTKDLTVASRDKIINMSESIEYDPDNEEAFISKMKDFVGAFSERGGSTAKGKTEPKKKQAKKRNWEFY